MKFFFLVLFLTLFTEVAFTSQESILPIASFKVESPGMGSSGPVSVVGTRGKSGQFESVSITAFGKTYPLEKSLLTKIPDNVNGLQLSFENGYKELGGRTIYLSFLRGFTSAPKDKITLSLTEAGKFDLTQ